MYSIGCTNKFRGGSNKIQKDFDMDIEISVTYLHIQIVVNEFELKQLDLVV